MVKGFLFDELPPPLAPALSVPEPEAPKLAPAPPSSSILKVAKIGKRPARFEEGNTGSKQVRFKTDVETNSKEKIVEAIQKISAHIGNASKFSKASKLALQLLESGKVTQDTVESFYGLLQTAMITPSQAVTAALRRDYHALFNAVQDRLDLFTPIQQTQIEVWILWAGLANEFNTDDTFVFSRAATRLKQEISLLPEASDDDVDDGDGMEMESDPFGLDALLPSERSSKMKKQMTSTEKLLKEKREALVQCLKIAADRYKYPWAQTIIDITAKFAIDNARRFSGKEREGVEKIWGTVKEQQVRRRQGKSSTGKLDITAFERYEDKYSSEKISIRKAVGSSGDRSAQQWLG